MCALTALAGGGSLAIPPTQAAFVSTTQASSSFAAGTLSLSLDDSATAQFSVSGMKPGDDPRSRCVTVTNTGTVDLSGVVLHVAGLGGTGLEGYVQFSVTRGANTGSTAPSCASMTQGGGVYAGALSGFPTSATTGVDDGGGALAVGATRAYQVDLTLVHSAAAQGKSVSFALTWTGSRSSWTGAAANPTSTLSASTDISPPTVTAATAVRTASPQVPGHVTQGSTYRFYAAASDTGAPATLVNTMTADLSGLTSGETAASLSSGSHPVGGTTYGYAGATLTAGSTLPLCRYAVGVTATDWAVNSSTTSQQVMVDRTLSTSTSRLRIDGPQGTSGVGWGQEPAGDVNGDGRTDWLVTAYTTSPLGRATAGAVYVVFGQAGTATIDLATVGTNGYAIQGAAVNDRLGYGAAALGDVNGDAVPDQLVTASYADNNSRADSGSAYVVFGKSSTTAVDLSALGSQGYRIDGAAAGDRFGTVAAAAGDLDGDGRGDMLVGAKYADNNGRTDSGSIYVLFGRSSTTTLDLASLGTGGYRIDGAVAGDLLGLGSISALGDLDADGTQDFAIGVPDADRNARTDSGSIYVLFGTSSTTTIDLAALGSSGYRIDGAAGGDHIGSAVSAAGDVNADGLPDLALGASNATRNGRSAAGLVSVVWGKASTSTQDLASLGAGGYRFDGAVAGDLLGSSVTAIGDVDGDGVPDLLAGARSAAEASGNGSGAAYVLFGSPTGGTTTDLAAYGTRGYRWEASGIGGDMAGATVADAGDVDGDGVHDLLVGAPGTDSNGRIDAGTVYLVLSPTCSYKHAVLQTPGLQSYWRLNEGSGTTVADSKGSVTGTYTGGRTLGVPGGTGDGDTAASFTVSGSGNAGFGDVYDFPGTTAFSLEAWLRISTEALDGTFARIVSKEGMVGGKWQGWDLEVSPAGGYPQIEWFARRIKFNRFRDWTSDDVLSTTRILPGRWYHVVVTSDASTLNLYVNGRLEATDAVTRSLLDHTWPMSIGPGSVEATVDDVAVYGVALTAAQVQQHYGMR